MSLSLYNFGGQILRGAAQSPGPPAAAAVLHRQPLGEAEVSDAEVAVLVQ